MLLKNTMDNDLRSFLIESMELINRVEELLLSAEAQKENGLRDIINAFGNIHSIKGNAMYLNFSVLIAGCQKAENFLSKADRSPRIPSEEEFDLLFKFVDAVRDLFKNLEIEVPLESAQERLSQWLDINEYQKHSLRLSPGQKDQIIEFFNMGNSKAASAFNELMACLIKLDVPSVDICSGCDDLFKLGILEDVVFSLSRLSFHCAFSGEVFILFTKEDAQKVTDILSGGNLEETIKEIGNIMTNHIIGSVSNILDVLIDYTVPVYREGRLGEILNSKGDFSNPSDNIIVISKIKFKASSVNQENQLIIFIKIKAIQDFLSAVDRKIKV